MGCILILFFPFLGKGWNGMFKMNSMIENIFTSSWQYSSSIVLKAKNILYFTFLYCHLVAPHITVIMDRRFATCVNLFYAQIDYIGSTL